MFISLNQRGSSSSRRMLKGRTHESRKQQAPAKSEFILYQTEDGKTKVEVRLKKRDRLVNPKANGGVVPEGCPDG